MFVVPMLYPNYIYRQPLSDKYTILKMYEIQSLWCAVIKNISCVSTFMTHLEGSEFSGRGGVEVVRELTPGEVPGLGLLCSTPCYFGAICINVLSLQIMWTQV